MSIKEVVENEGLKFQEHTVTTKDGYILIVHRVSMDFDAIKPPVFLQHGLCSSSENFMLNSSDSLAFQLANAGYDVWLGNNRGSIYSKNHASLDFDKDCEYFDYSFYEMGKFDAPAQIDHVLKETGFKSLSYIGNSQGTT